MGYKDSLNSQCAILGDANKVTVHPSQLPAHSMTSYSSMPQFCRKSLSPIEQFCKNIVFVDSIAECDIKLFDCSEYIK